MKRLSLLLLATAVQLAQWTYAQANDRQKIIYEDIFADLPVNDAAVNSVVLNRANAEDKIRRNIFVKAKINKQHCYEGEPILLEYSLYSALQSTSEIVGRPELAGFTSYPMFASNEQVSYTSINGQNYRVFKIHSWQLVPLETGELTIPPLQVSNTVRYTDETDGEQEYSGTVESNAVQITVHSLPKAGVPTAFDGAVGIFGIHSSLHKSEMGQNESNVLVVEIYGNGNIEQVSLPEINWPKNIKPYSPVARVEINQQVFPLTGKKVFEIPFVVTEAGKATIPAIAFPFFDPAKRSYLTVSTIPLALTVNAPLAKPAPLATPPASTFHWQHVLVVVLSVLALVCLLTYLYHRRQLSKLQQLQVEQDVDTDLQLEQDARMQLTELKGIEDTESYAGFYKEMVKGYLQERRRIPNLPEEYFLLMFDAKEKQLAELIRSAFAKCNAALYSNAVLDAAEREWLELSFEWILQWHRQEAAEPASENRNKPQMV